MHNRMLTGSELQTATANITRIEAMLGEKLPDGVIDMAQLSDHMLSSSEIQTLAANIHRLNFMRRQAAKPDVVIDKIGMWGFFAVCVVYFFGELIGIW